MGILAGTTAWLLPGRPPRTALLYPEPVTVNPGSERNPVLSPDGRKLSFTWNPGGTQSYHLYASLLDGNAPLKLAEDVDPALGPAWSPDGRFLAYLKPLDDNHLRAAVLVVPALGGQESLLTEAGLTGLPGVVLGSALDWRLDADHLILSDRMQTGEPLSLFLHSLHSGRRIRLTAPPPGSLGDIAPRLSPDRKRLAFIRIRDAYRSSLHVQPFKAEETAIVPPHTVKVKDPWVASPDWLPDGRHLIFAGGRMDTGTSLQVADLDHPEDDPLIIRNGQDGATPTVSATGVIAFARGTRTACLWHTKRRPLDSGTAPPRERRKAERAPFADQRGASAAEGRSAVWSNPRRFAAMTEPAFGPDYSPDGEAVAFASGRSGHWEIWISDRFGNQTRPLTRLSADYVAAPKWSPDGASVAFQLTHAGNSDIALADVQSGTVRWVTEEPSRETMPFWSRDGQWIYFISDRGGKPGVWKVAARADHPRMLGMAPVREAWESLDGRFLFTVRLPEIETGLRHSGLAAAASAAAPETTPQQDLSGAQPVSIWKSRLPWGPATLVAELTAATANIRSVESGLMWVAPPAKGQAAAIYSLPDGLAGTPRREITLSQAPSFGLAVSPLGNELIFSAWDYVESDLFVLKPGQQSLAARPGASLADVL